MRMNNNIERLVTTNVWTSTATNSLGDNEAQMEGAIPAVIRWKTGYILERLLVYYMGTKKTFTLKANLELPL